MVKEETTDSAAVSILPPDAPARPAAAALVPTGATGRRALTAGEPPRDRPATRRRVAIAILLAVLGLAIVAVGEWLLAPAVVAVTRPIRGPAVQAVYATGSVEASVLIPLSGRIAARLVRLDADEGDAVTKGEVLARFEDRDLQSALAQAEAQATFAKQEYDRAARLIETGQITKSAYDKAYSDWQAALSAAQRASAEAAFLELVSPADGIVVRRDGEIGQLIAANQTILWLAEKGVPRITSDVDEEDVRLVEVGQDVLIRADAFPGQAFHGRVQSITPMGDAVARSYRVRIALPADTPLRIGMTAETNIVVAEHDDALLLPATAVAGDKVWRVVDGRLAAVPVTVGIRGSDRVEIVAGLDAGDEVVLAPGSPLAAGARVRPVLQPPR